MGAVPRDATVMPNERAGPKVAAPRESPASLGEILSTWLMEQGFANDLSNLCEPSNVDIAVAR